MEVKSNDGQSDTLTISETSDNNSSLVQDISYSNALAKSVDDKILNPFPKIAYISGAYRSKWGFIGRIINIFKARKVGQKWLDKGYFPIISFVNTAFMKGKTEDWFIEGDLEIIKRLHRKSDCLVMMKGYKKSQGSLKELALAKKRRLSVIYEC